MAMNYNYLIYVKANTKFEVYNKKSSNRKHHNKCQAIRRFNTTF